VIIIRRLERGVQDGFFDLSADVLMDGVEQRLAFRRFGDHPELTARRDVADPFAVALLLPAMLRGVPLVVEDTVDERLLLALRGPIQDTLRIRQPAWRKIGVSAGSRPAPPPGQTPGDAAGRGGATALSGGIDSMHLLRHRALGPDVPESLRVRLLMHHHVGAHGDDDQVFAEQFAHVRGIASVTWVTPRPPRTPWRLPPGSRPSRTGSGRRPRRTARDAQRAPAPPPRATSLRQASRSSRRT
jgi:hypothetical protein